MNSRERILAAIDHQPVDRVPIDLMGTRQTGISVFAYAALRKHLGLAAEPPVRVFDLFQMLAEVEASVLHRFGSDCVGLYKRAVAFGIPNENWKPWTLPQGLRVEVPGSFEPVVDEQGNLLIQREGVAVGIMPEGGFYFDRLEKNPGATHPDLDAWEPPRVTHEELEYLRSEAERLHTTTDKAIVAPFGPPYELFYGLGQGGFEDWMATFATEPEYVEKLYRKLTDAWLENLEAFHGAVGERIHVLQIADDFGTQSAPFLSPRAFRSLVLPAYKRGLDWVHQKTPWKVLLHSDGALTPLLPYIVEMGVDILNPVQTTATGMDPAWLKREFGDRIAFWGGSCDCQGTLTRGAPEEVAEEVRRHLDCFVPGSGYVFASVHNIQANVPAANIVALFDAARDYDVPA